MKKIWGNERRFRNYESQVADQWTDLKYKNIRISNNSKLFIISWIDRFESCNSKWKWNKCRNLEYLSQIFWSKIPTWTCQCPTCIHHSILMSETFDINWYRRQTCWHNSSLSRSPAVTPRIIISRQKIPGISLSVPSPLSTSHTFLLSHSSFRTLRHTPREHGPCRIYESVNSKYGTGRH